MANGTFDVDGKVFEVNDKAFSARTIVYKHRIVWLCEIMLSYSANMVERTASYRDMKLETKGLMSSGPISDTTRTIGNRSQQERLNAYILVHIDLV